jgi:hypothetical protein
MSRPARRNPASAAATGVVATGREAVQAQGRLGERHIVVRIECRRAHPPQEVAFFLRRQGSACAVQALAHFGDHALRIVHRTPA